MCSLGDGYRFLRATIADADMKPSVLFQRTGDLEFPRDVTANQYGIRFLILHEKMPIKFEVVFEGRIELDPPEKYPWTKLPCLSLIDRFAEKLLANADRGLDEAIKSRNLIDLAVMRRDTEVPKAAIEKAEKAYPAKKSIRNLPCYECFYHASFTPTGF